MYLPNAGRPNGSLVARPPATWPSWRGRWQSPGLARLSRGKASLKPEPTLLQHMSYELFMCRKIQTMRPPSTGYGRTGHN